MLPRAVVIAGDVAWCDVCSTHDHRDDLSYIAAMESRGCVTEFTKSRGLTFWTPSPELLDMPIFPRWMQICDDQRVRTPPPSVQDVRDMMGDQTIEGVTVTDHESKRYPCRTA